MAQLGNYYTLCWPSRSRVNCGGRRSLAWPPLPLWSLGYLYPWPILHSLCAQILHRHTNCLSDTLLACAHTLTPPLSFSSSRQEHGIVSHVSTSSCVMGVMWGTHSAKRWGRVSTEELKGGVCVATSAQPFSCLCMKQAICLLTLI